MPLYEVITPLRRSRKTVPPGETVTLDEGEAAELLRKRAIAPVRVVVRAERPPPPPTPAKAPVKPAAKPKPAAKTTGEPPAGDDKGGGERSTTE